jgi:uncharacterized membrane protein YkvA (DUF1232 family)
MLEHLKQRVRAIRLDGHAIYLASRDPRVPWYAKAVAISIAAYALSPIDLIPDFIPVLGYLDEVIILPLGVALVVRLIPPDVMAEHRTAASASVAIDKPSSKAGAAAVVAIWLLLATLAGWVTYRLLT